MKFTLHFINHPYNPAPEMGLRFVNFIRDKAGVALPIDRICGTVNRIYEDKVELTYDQASAIGAEFEHKSHKYVSVPTGFLSGYLEPDVDLSRNPETGEITHAQMILRPNWEEIVRDYIDAGSPDRWGFDGE